MPMTPAFRSRLRGRLAATLVPLLLAACGGDGADVDTMPPPASCSVADQQSWLGSYVDEWYLWYALAPRPDPASYADAESYYRALLYTGTVPTIPADRWSGSQSTESFNRFYGDGATMGYGVSVAGLELDGDGTQPLYVRYVEPRSPAAAEVRRGDRVLFINGRSITEAVADNFSALSAEKAGDRLTLVLRRSGIERTVTLTAAEFKLTPVTGTSLLRTTGGRLIGYVNVKDMISQALAPADDAFAQFKSAGVVDLVFDLRYNGGGLVSTGATLASYVAGLRGDGRRYTTLRYNDKRAAASNVSYAFAQPASSLGLPRVFVLMGRRTCSASEQLINGLRGVGVQVVGIGETSCGKPVGFNPRSQCGRTYSLVNFDSVNDRGEGGYYDGLDATCAVAEDFTSTQGGWDDPLVDAAGRYADNGACPVASARKLPQGLRSPRRQALEPGERQGMLAR
jgi:hypothetical protein